MAENLKATVSNRIYLQVTPEQCEYICNELTYKLWVGFRKPGAAQKPKIVRMYTVIREDLLSIPSGRMDLIPEGTEITDKRACPPADFPEFKFKLRPAQQAIHDEVDYSCIINAQPSWGKTFCGVAIATKLKVKTLVIVHTLFLRDQWIAEIKKTLGIEAGVISGKTYNIDSPIVISNVQSLKSKVADLRKEFGLVIVDEAHHTPASTFQGITDALHAKYKIGLSGTLERKDGMNVVLQDYFSKKIFTPPEENMVKPTIHIIPTTIPFSDNNNEAWAVRTNLLYNNHSYQQLILNAAFEMAEAGYTVLVVSDRVALLEHLYEVLEEGSVLITGATKNREELVEQVRAGEKKIIFGTASIFSEGISINNLSCLIPALCINNPSLLTQLIGRIVRVDSNKRAPVVLDFLLEGHTAHKQAAGRAKVYRDREYLINKRMPI